VTKSPGAILRAPSLGRALRASLRLSKTVPDSFVSERNEPVKGAAQGYSGKSTALPGFYSKPGHNPSSGFLVPFVRHGLHGTEYRLGFTGEAAIKFWL